MSKSEPTPTLRPSTARLELGGEGLVDRFVDEDALGAGAGLTGVGEAGPDDARRRAVEVGVGADDGSVVAAELEDDGEEPARPPWP